MHTQCALNSIVALRSARAVWNRARTLLYAATCLRAMCALRAKRVGKIKKIKRSVTILIPMPRFIR